MTDKEIEQLIEKKLAETKFKESQVSFNLPYFKTRNLLWQDWTPTYSANGSMTFTSVTTHIARYCQIGKIVFFQIEARGTTGGTASDGLEFTLPITNKNTLDSDIAGGCIVVDGVYLSGLFYLVGGGSTIRVKKYDNSNYSLGANRGLVVQAFYEVV